MVKFEPTKMYKNLLRDKDKAFLLDEVIEKTKNGIHLNVSWYILNDKKQYTYMGFSGDFYIPKSESHHYEEVE